MKSLLQRSMLTGEPCLAAPVVIHFMDLLELLCRA